MSSYEKLQRLVFKEVIVIFFWKHCSVFAYILCSGEICENSYLISVFQKDSKPKMNRSRKNEKNVLLLYLNTIMSVTVDFYHSPNTAFAYANVLRLLIFPGQVF